MSTRNRNEQKSMFDFVEIPAPEKKKNPAAVPAPSATSPSLSDNVSTRDTSLEEWTADLDDQKGASIAFIARTPSPDEESDDDVLPSFKTPTTCPPSSATIPAAAFVADYCDHCRGRFEYPLKQYDTPLGVRQLCGACHKGE